MPLVWGMNRFAALLRAINVGGTGKLPMTDLVRLCEGAGFGDVRTFIASGNVVFSTDLPEGDARGVLERALREYAGKPVGVFVRSADELARLVAGNPFAQHPGNRTAVLFVDTPLSQDDLAAARGVVREELRLGPRAVYLHYPDGMGTSKLHLPAAAQGTQRNMNTVARLAVLAAGD